jgi:DNA-binding transcriptional LysR family regulator
MLNMQTDLLRTFATVADLRSFTRAGEALGRTQPAISLQNKRLEDMTRTTLFERDTGPLRLSPGGEMLAIYARQILCLHDEAVSRLLRPAVSGVIRVGLPNDFAITLLPSVLADFLAANPGIRLDVVCDISSTLLRGLLDGQHDVIVAMTAGQAGPPAAKLWAERLTWVVGAANGVAHQRPLPLVVHPEGCVYRARMTEALSRAGIAWKIACTTSSMGSLHAAVHAGLGVTVLSVNTVPPNLAMLASDRGFPGLADAVIGLYYAREMLSEPMQHLINFIIARLDSGRVLKAPVG